MSEGLERIVRLLFRWPRAVAIWLDQQAMAASEREGHQVSRNVMALRIILDAMQRQQASGGKTA